MHVNNPGGKHPLVAPGCEMLVAGCWLPARAKSVHSCRTEHCRAAIAARLSAVGQFLPRNAIGDRPHLQLRWSNRPSATACCFLPAAAAAAAAAAPMRLLLLAWLS